MQAAAKWSPFGVHDGPKSEQKAEVLILTVCHRTICTSAEGKQYGGVDIIFPR